MVRDNCDFNLLQELGQHYSYSLWYHYDHYNQQLLYPYVQPQYQQQVLWHSDLQKLQQRQWEELEQAIDMQRQLSNREEEEELKREIMAGRRFLSFLENDNSFLTPWNWNPDNAPVDNRGGPSTSDQMMRFELGSFFSDNVVYSSQHAKSKDISGTDAKLVSDDLSDQKPKVGKGVEKASKGFDVKVADQEAKGKGVKEASEGFDVKVANQKAKGKGVEEASERFDVKVADQKAKGKGVEEASEGFDVKVADQKDKGKGVEEASERFDVKVADQKAKGKGMEEASEGFDVKVANQKTKEKGVEKASEGFEVERLMSGTLTKMDG